MSELKLRPPPLGRSVSCERQIQIFDGFVDLSGVFVADGNAIHSGVAESEPHSGLAVFTIECALADQLHADYAHPCFTGLLNVGDNFWDVTQTVGAIVLSVHAFALVIHTD